MDWYYVHKGKRVGPVSEKKLAGLYAKKKLLDTDGVWNNTMGQQWQPISAVPEFAPRRIRGAPPGFKHTADPRRRRRKKRPLFGLIMAALILAAVVAGAIRLVVKYRSAYGHMPFTAGNVVAAFGEDIMLATAGIGILVLAVGRWTYIVAAYQYGGSSAAGQAFIMPYVPMMDNSRPLARRGLLLLVLGAAIAFAAVGAGAYLEDKEMMGDNAKADFELRALLEGGRR